MSKLNSTPSGDDEPMLPENTDQKAFIPLSVGGKVAAIITPTEARSFLAMRANMHEQEVRLKFFTKILETTQDTPDSKAYYRKYGNEPTVYYKRLLLSDEQIENILENEIFRNVGEMTELGTAFYDLLNTVTQQITDEEKKKQIKMKLIKEFKLNDRVYEGDTTTEIVPTWEGARIDFLNKEQFFKDIQEAGMRGERDFGNRFHSIPNDFDVPDFIQVLKIAGEAGFNILDLSHDEDFSHRFSAFELMQIIIQAGISGFRAITFREIDFYRYGYDMLIDIVKIAGMAGIREFDISNNGLFIILNALKCKNLVKIAGMAGIRSLDISDNQFSERMSATGLVKIAESAGESGIRDLDIRNFDAYDGIEDLKNGEKVVEKLPSIAEKYNMNLIYY